MVLDPDCVRDVLLSVEASSFGERITLNSLRDKIPQYSEETLWYTCLKLQEGGYLDLISAPVMRMPMPAIQQIKGLTFYGHEFLDSIREDGNWGKVKSVAKEAGTFSIGSLGEIAKEIAKAAILSALQSTL